MSRPNAQAPATRALLRDGVPTGIRTPVATVKGLCPRPLDDGDPGENRRAANGVAGVWWSQPGSNRRPLACHASALPTELWSHERARTVERVPLGCQRTLPG